MNHHATRSKSSLSRRTALGSIGAATALSLGNMSRAAAQDANLASHPMTGTWLAMANQAPARRRSPRRPTWGPMAPCC